MSLKISEFSDGTIEIYDTFEEGGPQITCTPEGLIQLWMIPQYGGEPTYHGCFSSIQLALNHGRNL